MANPNIVDFRTSPRIIPVVRPATPNSPPIVKHCQVIGGIAGPWLEATGVNSKRETTFDVNGIFRKQGYRLLEHLYLEENNPAGWADYQRYLADWQAGETENSFPRHQLPKQLQDTKAAMRKADPWSPENTGAIEASGDARSVDLADENEYLRMRLAELEATQAKVA